MSRLSSEEILRDAEQLAERFERWEPSASRSLDASPMRALHAACERAAAAQAGLDAAVGAARAAGFSWAYIGSVLGTNGDAARKRYKRRSAPLPLAHRPVDQLGASPPLEGVTGGEQSQGEHQQGDV